MSEMAKSAPKLRVLSYTGEKEHQRNIRRKIYEHVNKEASDEFGIKINEKLAQVEAHLLPLGLNTIIQVEKDCLPQVGQWNTMNKKMVNGGTVNNWICINFSCSVQDSVARGFCSELAQMCMISRQR